MISNENPHSQTPALSRGRVVRLWASLMLIDMACVAIAFAIVDITFFYFSPSPRPLIEYVYAFFFLGLYKLTVHPQYWVALWLLMRRRMDAYAPGVRAFFTLFLTSFIIPYALFVSFFLIPGLFLEGFRAILDVLDTQYELWFTPEGRGFLPAAFLGTLVSPIIAPFIARRFWNTSPQA